MSFGIDSAGSSGTTASFGPQRAPCWKWIWSKFEFRASIFNIFFHIRVNDFCFKPFYFHVVYWEMSSYWFWFSDQQRQRWLWWWQHLRRRRYLGISFDYICCFLYNFIFYTISYILEYIFFSTIQGMLNVMIKHTLFQSVLGLRVFGACHCHFVLINSEVPSFHSLLCHG